MMTRGSGQMDYLLKKIQCYNIVEGGFVTFFEFINNVSDRPGHHRYVRRTSFHARLIKSCNF